MVKLIPTKTMALLIAAGLPTSNRAFAPVALPTPNDVASTQPSLPTTLLAHARRSHTVTSQTKNEENTVQSVFAKIDKDGNGKIDRRELQDYLTSEGPYTKAVAQSIFDRLDENRDGHLVPSELATGMLEHQLFRAITQKKNTFVQHNPQETFALKQQQRHHQPNKQQRKKKKTSMKQWRNKMEQKAQLLFQAMDADRDGSISLAELKEHFLVRRMQAVAESNGLLASLKSQPSHTKASDSVVPWHHSETAVQKLFQTLDVNADGRISSKDLREAFVRYPSVRHAFQV